MNESLSIEQAIRNLQPHDHLCLIYDTPEEWRTIILPFLVFGLERNEKCMYLADAHTADQVRGQLQEAGVDVAAREASGQLVIRPATEVYTVEGHFSPDRMIASLIAETERAIAEGYSALRITGEMSWVLRTGHGAREILEYETKLNRDFFPKYPCVAICQYNCGELEPELIKKAIATHPLLVSGKRLYRNPDYVPPGECSGQKDTDYEIKQWQSNIERKREIQEHMRFLAGALDASSQPFVASNPDGSIITCNPAFCELTGYTWEELRTMSCDQLINPSWRKSKAKALEELWSTGKPGRHMSECLRKDGSRVPVEMLVHQVCDQEGHPLYYYAFVIDITERKRTENALREAENKYRTIFENTGTATAFVEEDMTISLVNAEFEKLFGYAREEVEGKKSWTEFIAKEDVERLKQYHLLRKIDPSAAPGNYQFRALDKQGNVKYVLATVAVIPGTKKSLASCLDITERKRTEERLAKINDCFVNFVPDATENIKRLTALCGELLGATCALYNRLERGLLCSIGQWRTPPDYNPIDKPEGHICFDVIQKGGKEVFVVRNLQQSPYAQTDPNVVLYQLQTYIGKAVRCGKDYVGSLCVVYQKDFVPTEEDKRIIGILAAAIGVEEDRQRAEQAREESEERYRTLVENINEVVFTLDTRGYVTYISPVIERVSGFKVDEITGQPVRRFVYPEDLPGVLRWLERTLAGEIGLYEFRVLDKNGNVRYVRTSGRPLRQREQLVGLTGIMVDVTGCKEKEAELKRSSEKLRSALEGTIQAMARLVGVKDPYTAEHQRRVAELACAIAKEMGLPEDQIKGLHFASIIHDIGKIAIPAEILNKPGRLNDAEFSLIRSHPKVGYDILATTEFPWPIGQIVLQHHERMDGSGYPSGLKGRQILLEARILGVADVVEAMASHRPYRPAQGINEALEEIIRYRGVLFDPDVVDACLLLFNQKGFTFEESA